MARTRRASEKRRLPSKLTSPTFTFGPSSTTKTRMTAFGGMRRRSWPTLAKCRPRSASSSCSTTSPPRQPPPAPPHPRRVVLHLDRQAHPRLPEALEDLRLGDGLDAPVVDAADERPLHHDEVDDLALLAVLDLQADVFEEVGVPDGLEIAPQDVGVVGVARLGGNPGVHGGAGGG